MRYFTQKIFCILAFAVFLSGQAKAALTVETILPTSNTCTKGHYGIPIQIKNLIGCTEFHLTLTFDQNVIQYVRLQNSNPALSGSSIRVTSSPGKIVLDWSSSVSATILDDFLTEMVFKAREGTTEIKWDVSDPSTSYYKDAAGDLPAQFTDGTTTVFSSGMSITLIEIEPTCKSKCDAIYKATLKGGVGPFSYLWNGVKPRFDSIKENLCVGENNILITDSRGCELDSNFFVPGMPGVQVELIYDPDKDGNIYRQNPVLTFSLEETSGNPILTAIWDFGDGSDSVTGVENVTHVFENANTNIDNFYILTVKVLTPSGCDTTISQKLNIKDLDKTHDRVIPNFITPNSSPGYNDTFVIKNENKQKNDPWSVSYEYERMQLIIWDRNGRKVYSSSNYQNDWKAEGLSDGVYFYFLKMYGKYKDEVVRGSITVLGGSGTK